MAPSSSVHLPLYIVYPPLTQHDAFPTREIAAFPIEKKNLTQPTDFGAIGKGPHGKATCSRGLRICKPEANEVCRSCTAPERLVGAPIAWHWPRRTANTRLLRKYALDAGKVPGVANVPGVAVLAFSFLVTRRGG